MNIKSHVLENIMENYKIKDEERITSATVYQILEHTQIKIQELKKCFGIPNNIYTKLRKGEECYFTCKLCTNIDKNKIRYKANERKILKQYIKEEYLTYQDIREIRKYITDDIRLIKILNIDAEKYIKIINGKIKRTKNTLFDYQDKAIIQKNIIKNIRNKENITFSEIENVKIAKGYTDYQIKESLNISTKQYRELKDKKIHKLRIMTQKEKVKIDLLKIDLENLNKFGERDYSSEEVKNICKEYAISIDTFIKNIIGNKKNPQMTKKVINKVNGKIYLGKNKKISNELMEKIYMKKDKTIENLAKMIAQMYGQIYNFEDLKQEVYLKLMESGGIIETNLAYDENLIINSLMKGIKYPMYNYLSKNKNENSLIQMTNEGEFDLLNVIEDNTYNPEYLVQCTDSIDDIEEITNEHVEFYKILKKYSDLMIDNRSRGFEKLSETFNMNLETVAQKVLEIQTLIIKSKLVKIDSKGRVLLNEVY